MSWFISTVSSPQLCKAVLDMVCASLNLSSVLWENDISACWGNTTDSNDFLFRMHVLTNFSWTTNSAWAFFKIWAVLFTYFLSLVTYRSTIHFILKHYPNFVSQPHPPTDNLRLRSGLFIIMAPVGTFCDNKNAPQSAMPTTGVTWGCWA